MSSLLLHFHHHQLPTTASGLDTDDVAINHNALQLNVATEQGGPMMLRRACLQSWSSASGCVTEPCFSRDAACLGAG
jgi:hypothetical protein